MGAPPGQGVSGSHTGTGGVTDAGQGLGGIEPRDQRPGSPAVPTLLKPQRLAQTWRRRGYDVTRSFADAMAQSARTRSITGLVADMRAEDGQPSEEDYAWARRALGVE